jgi:putative aldouronate transport system permease protein
MVLRDIIVSTQAFGREMDLSSIGEDMSSMILLGESMKYALIIVSTLPIMCLYPFIQRYFIKGIMIGSIKG